MGLRRENRSWWERRKGPYKAQKVREYRERLTTIGMLLDANWSQSNGWFEKHDHKRYFTDYFDHNGKFLRRVNYETSSERKVF